MHFHEITRQENIQLSAHCVSHFETLIKIIETHEHYPLVITQRMIETSRAAEKIIIRSHDETIIKEWQYKYEKIVAEMNSWREKVTWYESEHNRYIHEIQVLKQRLEQS